MSLGGFGDKLFEVSDKRIHTFNNFSNTMALKVEEQEVDNQKPSIYKAGIENEKPSFDIYLKQSSNLDVQTEFDDWKKILYDGEPHMLFIGDVPISENKFLLQQISPSEFMYDPYGKLIKVKLTLNFIEYPRAGVKKENKTS